MSSAGAVACAMAFLLAAMPPAASAGGGGGGILEIPSAHSLEALHCPSSCGAISISYPFGIGAGCFRQGFELTCDHTNPSPKLFLGNTTTHRITNMYVDVSPLVSIFFNITLESSRNSYNMSWEAPAKGITILNGNSFYFLGCDFEVNLFDSEGSPLGSCISRCHSKGLPDQGPCNGLGCCLIPLPTMGISGFLATVVQADGMAAQSDPLHPSIMGFMSYSYYGDNATDLFSSWTNTSNIDGARLEVAVMDQPSCKSARNNNTSYACAADSTCTNATYGGYTCSCSIPYTTDNNNAYLLGGCAPRQDYNPRPQGNCTRSCGNMTNIPFPFGIEEGCYGNERFRLTCKGDMLQYSKGGIDFNVTAFSVQNGTVTVSSPQDSASSNVKEVIAQMNHEGLISGFGGPLKDRYGSSMKYSYIVIKLAVNNVTCEQAMKNPSSYACSNNICHNMTHGGIFMGYICQCPSGVTGNPYDPDGCTICPHGKDYDRKSKRCVTRTLYLGIAIGVSCGIGSVILALCSIILAKKWKKNIQKRIRREYFKKNQGLLLQQLISDNEHATNKTKIFSLDELEEATNNFDPTRVVGRGGHGTVYKGILSDQRVVAIKKSKIVEQTEIDQLINEVAILSQIIHRNVVKLFGCCLESEVPLLVCEFISNGTLHDILHLDVSSKCILTWDDRIRIAVEISGALSYLHSAAAIPIFHRDVKSSNVLLDDSLIAKVSDFGASRSLSLNETHVVTGIQGTFGYLDPEYYATGQLTEKSDVYSFGVILVELLTRKKQIFINDLGEKQSLPAYFVEGIQERKLLEIIDSQVVEEAEQEDIEDIASLAEACLRFKGGERPTMKEVEMRLQFMRNKMQRKAQCVPDNDEGIDTLFCPIAKNQHAHIHPTNNAAHLTPQGISGYSLELEFGSSTSLPR